ncbi:hypothetical protein ElyMa_000297900 [Elysia marginata]|uniref:Uncharacterized protein n=1 Tax=Elysia marginata TaxID=1093978 RepID=A0AAV4F869_9GAST|nr:hypothetical protein ElyMa_000297900 [Elysia marginata]
MTMLQDLTSLSISTQQGKQSYFHKTPTSVVCIYVDCNFGRLPSIDYSSPPMCRLKLQQSFNRRPLLKKSRLIPQRSAYLQIILGVLILHHHFSSLANHRALIEQPAYTRDRLAGRKFDRIQDLVKEVNIELRTHTGRRLPRRVPEVADQA